MNYFSYHLHHQFLSVHLLTITPRVGDNVLKKKTATPPSPLLPYHHRYHITITSPPPSNHSQIIITAMSPSLLLPYHHHHSTVAITSPSSQHHHYRHTTTTPYHYHIILGATHSSITCSTIITINTNTTIDLTAADYPIEKSPSNSSIENAHQSAGHVFIHRRSHHVSPSAD